MPRRSAIIALITCLLFGAIGAATTVFTRGADELASNGRSWTITSGDTFALRTNEGALGVKESVSVNFKGGFFRGFYRDIPLSPKQTSEVVSVSDDELGTYRSGGSSELGSFGDPGTFGTEVLPQGRRIVWHHDSIGKKTFTSVYGIQPVGARYPDGDWLKVSMWGDDWPSFVPSVKGTLAFKAPLPAGAKVATSPAWIGAKTTVSGKNIELSAKDIPAYQGLSITIRMPRGSLPGAVVSESGNAPSQDKGILDPIKRAGADSPLARFFTWALGLLLLGQLPALGWLIFNRRRLADATAGGAEPFEYKPPEGHSLAGGYVAAEETQPPSDRAFVAVLMDLIARGHYKRENVRDEKTGDWRLQIALPGNRDESEQLTGGEEAVRSFTDSLLEEGPCIVDNLDSRVNPAEHRFVFGHMKMALARDGKEIMKAQRSANWWVKLVALLWVTAIAYLTVMLTSPDTTVGSLMVILAVLVVFILTGLQLRFWPRSDFVHTPAELAPVQADWQRWRDWILNFDQMNEAPDLGVILWERAFAGAVMWGVAAKFVARAKVLVPDLDDNALALGNTVFFASTLGSSISSSATPASSSSGGGSFGGGGFSGGDGGGGGGGAW